MPARYQAVPNSKLPSSPAAKQGKVTAAVRVSEFGSDKFNTSFSKIHRDSAAIFPIFTTIRPRKLAFLLVAVP
jgi:hypothetical protein